tara:strand:+ start:5596 stop:6054 length:459 start_codon:yes stop_codon:yes gene_type:complete
MIEFNYDIDYKNTMFSPNDSRYRIGRGEQGVLLIRPYTDIICRYWRFKTLDEAKVSASTIFNLFLEYRDSKDFVGMDMCRKFLEMGFTRARRYANHRNGRKYNKDGTIIPQEKDALTCEKAKCARVFKSARDMVMQDPIYEKMRRYWRANET